MHAGDLTHSLRGKWYGQYGVAPCPVCQPEARKDQDALTLRDGDGGRLLAHCKKSGCDFKIILSAAGVTQESYSSSTGLLQATPMCSSAAEKQKADRARQCWDEAEPIQGTPAETYLRSRSITFDLPDTLRFHAACWHGPTTKRLPAMVARIDGGEGFAIHRTFLARNGSGKAPVNPQKMMLGPCRGGAVRLAEPEDVLLVGEGIETCLSALQATGYPAWAALSTSGLRALDMPDTVRDVIVLADGDDAGEATAQHCAGRWTCEGRKVRIARPPRGMDFNDVLIGSESSSEVIGS